MQTAVSARIACLCTPKATPRASLLRSAVRTSSTVRTSSSFLSTPLRQQHKRHLACSGRRSHATVRAAAATGATFYDYSVKNIDGRDQKMSSYKGKVVLAVNVASQCGFTKQYKELGELYDKYQKKGLVILGFPCNQFNGQEPGDNKQIKAFAKSKGADFPMMSKIEVNGGKADPLYNFLKSKKGGILTSDIKWNFTKFLIGKNGEVVKRYGSVTEPNQIEGDIEKLLSA